MGSLYFLEATPGFEPGNQGFADPCLTTWLCRHMQLYATVAGISTDEALNSGFDKGRSKTTTSKHFVKTYSFVRWTKLGEFFTTQQLYILLLPSHKDGNNKIWSG